MANFMTDAQTLHQQHPSWSALQVATQVLGDYPQTESLEMVEALGFAGFSTSDANAAAEHLYGQSESVIISAKSKWQDTGILIEGNQATTITYVSGSWTANPATGMVDAAGNSAYLAKQGYTLPGAPEGALIGWIGEVGAKEGEVDSAYDKFLVGKGAVAPLGQNGYLFLSINDDETQEYGVGFPDNEGNITVKIVEAKAGVSS